MEVVSNAFFGLPPLLRAAASKQSATIQLRRDAKAIIDMATNPIPKGTKNLTVNIPDALHTALKKQAVAEQLTLSRYVRAVLRYALDNEIPMEQRFSVAEADVLMAAEPVGAYNEQRETVPSS